MSECNGCINLGNKCQDCKESSPCDYKLPPHEYPINEDTCPTVINKKPNPVEQIQDITVKYLKPVAPEPGPLIYRPDADKTICPAPPLVVEERPPSPFTPPPMVFREEPPELPCTVLPEIIHIPGKTLPAPPRQVITEIYESLPQKPQPVIVERWLPYDVPERPIIHDCKPPEPIAYKKKNIIIKYDCPEVCVKQKFHHMPIECVNPCEYISKYGPTLKKSSDLPAFVKEIKTHIELASNKPSCNPCAPKCPPQPCQPCNPCPPCQPCKPQPDPQPYQNPCPCKTCHQ